MLSHTVDYFEDWRTILSRFCCELKCIDYLMKSYDLLYIKDIPTQGQLQIGSSVFKREIETKSQNDKSVSVFEVYTPNTETDKQE